MSQTIASLQRKINIAGDLQTVVRTMKAIAASSIGQYERSLESLSEYYRTVELGLSVCFRCIASEPGSLMLPLTKSKIDDRKVSIVVFGSDQGLIGQFNEIITEHTVKILEKYSTHQQIWAVGERISTHLIDGGLELQGTFSLPNSVKGITALVAEILMETNAYDIEKNDHKFYLIYNHRTAGASYEPKESQLLPFSNAWQSHLAKQFWPTQNLPELIGLPIKTLNALIREYLFVSIFKACTESLASENASRLSAMQRADKNIEELLDSLKGAFHHLRQEKIDEELFDVISGFEALSHER